MGLQVIEMQRYQNKNNVVPAFYFQLENTPLSDTPNSVPRFCPDLFLFFLVALAQESASGAPPKCSCPGASGVLAGGKVRPH